MSNAARDEYAQRYMSPGESVLFREKVVSHAAFRISVFFALVFGLGGLVALALGAAGAMPLGIGLGAGAPSLVFGVLMGILGVMFSVFRVMITGSNVHVHFGWTKRKIPLSTIQSIGVKELVGLRQGKVQIGLDGVVRTTPQAAGLADTLRALDRKVAARGHSLTGVEHQVGEDLSELTGSAREPGP